MMIIQENLRSNKDILIGFYTNVIRYVIECLVLTEILNSLLSITSGKKKAPKTLYKTHQLNLLST